MTPDTAGGRYHCSHFAQCSVQPRLWLGSHGAVGSREAQVTAFRSQITSLMRDICMRLGRVSPQTLQTSLLFAECRYHYSNHLIKRLIILGDLSSRTLD